MSVVTLASAAVSGLKKPEKAHLVPLDGELNEIKGEKIPFKFNPTEYQVQKSNSFAEVPIPGIEAPPIQFIRGAAEKLTFELLLDTTQEKKDVRKEYVDKLRALLDIDGNQHAPPVVRFYWSTNVFTGVVESLSVTYQLFDKNGVPMRAKASLSLKEFRPAVLQVRERPKNSPDVEKLYTVQRGDTLTGIASAAFGDPSKWREIARHNGIEDPRSLDAGAELVIPRLTGGRR